MRRTLLAAIVALLVPATAVAKPPTHRQAGVYEFLRHRVADRLGHRVPGRDILIHGLAPTGRKASARDVEASIVTYQRWLWPPPPPPAPALIPTASYTAASQSPGYTSYTASGTSPGGLAGCVINAESSGNPTASNGSHSGLGGWAPSTWVQDHGPQITGSATPTGASYSGQVQVLQAEGTSGMETQQVPYEGGKCG